MTPIILNEELVRDIDDIYTDYYITFVTACVSRHGNPDKVRLEMFGDVIATLFPGDPHFNHVFKLNEERIGHLPQIVDFYKGHQALFWVTMNPFDFSTKVSSDLIKYGLHPAGYHTKFIGTSTETESHASPSISVEGVTEKTLESAVETALEGSGVPRKEWGRQAPYVRILHQIPQIHWFLASADEKPAGTGALYVRDRLAYLSSAETRPSFRRMGCHTALINRRLRLAAELGYELVVGAADFGTSSFRNLMRAGLQIAYTEAWWIKYP